MGLILLLIVGLAFTVNGLAIWSLVLYGDVKKTKCKKLAGVLVMCARRSHSSAVPQSPSPDQHKRRWSHKNAPLLARLGTESRR
jgi:hypothetical protein